MQKGFTANTQLRCLRTIYAVNEFGQAYRRECSVLVSGHTYNSLDQPFDGISSALGSDNHTGVEDQSPAGGLSGSR